MTTVLKNNQIEVVLGLDISTSIVGWYLLEKQTKSVVNSGHIQLTTKGLDNLFKKAEKTISELSSSIPPTSYDLKEIYVEANAKMFAGGGTTADTLMTLAKMNVLVSYLAHKLYNAEVIDVNVTRARSAIGYKDNRSVKRPVKEKVRDFVLTTWPNLNAPTRIATAGKNKGQPVIQTGIADEIDAFVIVYGGLLLHAGTSNTTRKIGLHNQNADVQGDR